MVRREHDRAVAPVARRSDRRTSGRTWPASRRTGRCRRTRSDVRARRSRAPRGGRARARRARPDGTAHGSARSRPRRRRAPSPQQHVDVRRDVAGQPVVRLDEHHAVAARGRRVRLGDALHARADDQRLDVRMAVFAARWAPCPRRQATDAGHAVGDQPFHQVDGVQATTGSTNGCSTPTNAQGSSAPAEYTPLGRPWIGERHTTSTPFASSADASVSPSNPASSRPSNVNDSGLERSIASPPTSSRLTPTAPPADTDLVRRRVAQHVEPAAASRRVHPPLRELALRVVAHEQVVGPLLVGQCLGVGRVRQTRLSPVSELRLVARAAPWAGDQQHVTRLPRRTPRPRVSAPSSATPRSTTRGPPGASA